VAGYDLTKFMVGQRGIFGNLLTVTTRTYRQPHGAILARHAPDASIVGKLIPTSLRPQWAVLTRQALFCGYLGDRKTLDFYRHAVGQIGVIERIERTLDEDIAHRTSLWSRNGAVAYRASVPPARLADFVANVSGDDWAADAAFGIVVGATGEPRDIPAIREAAATAGGTLRSYRGPYGQPIELSTTPGEREIIQRLKQAFDPDSTLQPLPWQNT
jgi:FAD/FMN-containing dehydrogenase